MSDLITCPCCAYAILFDRDESDRLCPACGTRVHRPAAPQSPRLKATEAVCPVCDERVVIPQGSTLVSCPSCGSAVVRTDEAKQELPETSACCPCCLQEVHLPAGSGFISCPYCGTGVLRPRRGSETGLLLRRAELLRMNMDFYQASQTYASALLQDPDCHEAFWGLVLCRYGVEFIGDDKGNLQPVLHRLRPRPVQMDGDYRMACTLAPAEVRAQYEATAARMDEILARMQLEASRMPSYDVTLCYRATSAQGTGYSQDYLRAATLYRKLTEAGLRVFFPPESLRDAGRAYDVSISGALNASRAMLLICSDADSLDSPWVRSEWTHYLELVDDMPDRQLIPLLYGDFTHGDLPLEIRLRSLPSLRMDAQDSVNALLRFLHRA